MYKTAKDIEKDVYRLTEDFFRDKIHGKTYRKGMRPKDAHTEDIIVAFAAGYDAQMQSGEVYVHIYVPFRRGVSDITRIGEIERYLLDYRKILGNNSEYLFSINSSPNDMNVDEIEQSLVSVIINYKRYTI